MWLHLNTCLKMSTLAFSMEESIGLPIIVSLLLWFGNCEKLDLKCSESVWLSYLPQLDCLFNLHNGLTYHQLPLQTCMLTTLLPQTLCTSFNWCVITELLLESCVGEDSGLPVWMKISVSKYAVNTIYWHKQSYSKLTNGLWKWR